MLRLTSEQVANIEAALRYARARYYDSWYLPPGSLDIEDYDGYGWGDSMAVRF
jgi:hypothetical protein